MTDFDEKAEKIKNEILSGFSWTSLGGMRVDTFVQSIISHALKRESIEAFNRGIEVAAIAACEEKQCVDEALCPAKEIRMLKIGSPWGS